MGTKKKAPIAMAKQNARRRSGGVADLVRVRPIDGHVGARVKLRRIMLGMSQQTLGKKLGITFQQLQKNEGGVNRIASSRLLDLSRALDVPIQYFFDDMTDAMAGTVRLDRGGDATARAAVEPSLLTRRETLELVRYYSKIKDFQVRRKVYQLAKSLSDDAE